MNQFIVGDAKRCIGCGTCQIACSNAHYAVGLQAQPRLSVIETRKVSAITACHHCPGAPCARVCPKNVIHHEGNFIRVEEKDCIGCKLCSLACPFGAIHPSGTTVAGVAGIKVDTPTYSEAMAPTLKWEIGVHTVAVKCDLCYFDPMGPNCVRVCPTLAIKTVQHPDAEGNVATTHDPLPVATLSSSNKDEAMARALQGAGNTRRIAKGTRRTTGSAASAYGGGTLDSVGGKSARAIDVAPVSTAVPGASAPLAPASEAPHTGAGE